MSPDEHIEELLERIKELEDKIAFALYTLDTDEEEFNEQYEEWK